MFGRNRNKQKCCVWKCSYLRLYLKVVSDQINLISLPSLQLVTPSKSTRVKTVDNCGNWEKQNSRSIHRKFTATTAPAPLQPKSQIKEKGRESGQNAAHSNRFDHQGLWWSGDQRHLLSFSKNVAIKLRLENYFPLLFMAPGTLFSMCKYSCENKGGFLLFPWAF